MLSWIRSLPPLLLDMFGWLICVRGKLPLLRGEMFILWGFLSPVNGSRLTWVPFHSPFWATFSCKELIFWRSGFASMEIYHAHLTIWDGCALHISFAIFLSHGVHNTSPCLWTFSSLGQQDIASLMGQLTLRGQATLLQGLSLSPPARHEAVPILPGQYWWPSQKKADWSWCISALWMPKEAFAKLLTASQVLSPASDQQGDTIQSNCSLVEVDISPKVDTDVPTAGPSKFLYRPNRTIKGKCIHCLTIWEEHS